jgi:hypothetical protein
MDQLASKQEECFLVEPELGPLLPQGLSMELLVEFCSAWGQLEQLLLLPPLPHFESLMVGVAQPPWSQLVLAL